MFFPSNFSVTFLTATIIPYGPTENFRNHELLSLLRALGLVILVKEVSIIAHSKEDRETDQSQHKTLQEFARTRE